MAGPFGASLPAKASAGATAGIRVLFGVASLNDEFGALCGISSAQQATAAALLTGIGSNIANIRAAIEDGLADTAWANDRPRGLQLENQQAEALQEVARSMATLASEDVRAYRRDTEGLIGAGSPADLTKLVRKCVPGTKPAPDALTVEIQYKVPEPVVKVTG